MEMLIGLISGAIGGNIGGSIFKNLSLGTLGNSLAGVVGGALLPWILNSIGLGGAADAMSGSGLAPMELVSQIGGGLVGGTGTMALVGAVKNMMNK